MWNTEYAYVHTCVGFSLLVSTFISLVIYINVNKLVLCHVTVLIEHLYLSRILFSN